MNKRILIGVAAGVMLVASSCVFRPAVRLVYNATPSAPRGFYLAMPATELSTGDLVLVRLPAGVAQLAAERGYLPLSVPALKQIAAVTGTVVCVRNSRVYVRGQRVGEALAADAQRRELRAWNGCRALVDGELFLLNVGAAASFDSRYFGPLDRSFVRARAVPVWIW